MEQEKMDWDALNIYLQYNTFNELPDVIKMGIMLEVLFVKATPVLKRGKEIIYQRSFDFNDIKIISLLRHEDTTDYIDRSIVREVYIQKGTQEKILNQACTYWPHCKGDVMEWMKSDDYDREMKIVYLVNK